MKRVMRIVSLALVFAMLLGISAMAAEDSLGAGFYGIGSAKGVTIEARDADNDEITGTAATVNGVVKTYYEGAVRLSVTYKGAAEKGDQFLVLLVTGDGLPTASDAICYINQEAKGTDNITFDVYPILPAKATEMTLYITSNNEDFKTIAIPVSYAPAKTYTEAPFVFGNVDMDKDNKVDVLDVGLVMGHIVESVVLEGNAFLAADVADKRGVVDISDAAKILNFIVENINSLS